MKKKIHCKICGSDQHWQTFCPRRKRPRIKPESDKARTKRMITNRIWRKNNPPDADGYYTCYLQISSMCTKRMTPRSVTREHVQPKVKAPHLKYNPDNLRPACSWCNKLKGSKTLEQLIGEGYTHLERYL